jgi:hypothetical protein
MEPLIKPPRELDERATDLHLRTADLNNADHSLCVDKR